MKHLVGSLSAMHGHVVTVACDGSSSDVCASGNSLARRRFTEVFTKDDNDMPRSWSPKVNIPAIAQDAKQAAAKVLALLAVIRGDDLQVYRACPCNLVLLEFVAVTCRYTKLGLALA